MARKRRVYVCSGTNTNGYRWRDTFTVKRDAERAMRAERAILETYLRAGLLPKRDIMRSLSSLRLRVKEADRG